MRTFISWTLILAIVAASPAWAETYFWNANGTSSPANGGTGTWDTTNTRWREVTNTGSAVAWPTAGTDTAAAVFAGTAGTVTLSGSLEANSLTFNTTGYTLSSGTLALVGSTPTISSTVAAATISSVIAGSAGVTKAGTGGLTLSGANTFSGPVDVSAGTLTVASASGLGMSTSAVVAGTLAFNSSSALSWSGSVSGAGTIAKTGNGNVSLTLDDGSTMGEITTAVTSGTLSLAAASPTSTVTLTRLRGALNGQMAITSGTWSVGDLGANSAGAQMRSTLTISNATLVTGNGRYINGNFVLSDGGVFRVTADRFGFGNEQNFGAPTLEIGSGGLLDIYSTNYGSRVGGAIAASTTLLRQTGGTAMFGVTDGSNTSNRNLLLSGGSAGTPTASTKTAYDLSGGTLFVRGTLLAGTATDVITNFNFRGGVLAVNAYTAANIGSSTDAADPFANSTDVGTLVNRGGTLAPGGIGTAGRTTITGNYRVDSGAFAVDIGGTTQGNAFQNGAGSYDFVNVNNGAATLGGTLVVSLTGGYTPPSNTTTLFNVLNSTNTGADLSGSFTNVVVATSGHRRIVLADGLASLLVATNTTAATATVGGLTSVPARTVSLGGYQATNAYSGAGIAWDSTDAASWTAFDPGATADPSTVASAAIARFADDTASTGTIDVSLSSTRNVRGIQFASTEIGANARSYTISQGGSGALVLDNGGDTVTIADSSAAGNTNALDVPLTLAGSLEAEITNATTSLTLGGDITGVSHGLTKTGAGRLVLGGANDYTGATTVTAGTLEIGSGGVVNATSSLSVAAGARLVVNGAAALTVAPQLLGAGSGSRAILGGSGRIDAALTLDNVGDTLSPGNSPGIMTFGQSQNWSAFSYDWEVNNFTGLTAGSAFDQIQILGGLTLSGSTGSYALNVLSLTSGNVAGEVPNFSETSREWTILTTTGGIDGFDLAHWSLDTTGFTPVGQGSWSLQQSESGSDLMLVYYAAVPEPATAALACCGIACAAVLLARRRTVRSRPSR